MILNFSYLPFNFELWGLILLEITGSKQQQQNQD